MNLAELVDRTQEFMASLGGRLDPAVRESITELLETGEEGLALEYLMGGLVRPRIPVTREESDELFELLSYFSGSSGNATPAESDEPDYYWSITHPSQAVAELNVQAVVDETVEADPS